MRGPLRSIAIGLSQRAKASLSTSTLFGDEAVLWGRFDDRRFHGDRKPAQCRIVRFKRDMPCHHPRLLRCNQFDWQASVGIGTDDDGSIGRIFAARAIAGGCADDQSLPASIAQSKIALEILSRRHFGKIEGCLPQDEVRRFTRAGFHQ